MGGFGELPGAPRAAAELAEDPPGLEPMQIGGVKALGIQKPWAPPRSYGLLVQLDANGEVTSSFHSRAGGRFHGITGGCITPQGLVIASRGAGRLLLEREGPR